MSLTKPLKAIKTAKVVAPKVASRGRPTADIGEERLRNLFRVGFHHFVVRGVKGANLKAIAEEAGVTRQMIHARFGTKENFFDAILLNSQFRLFRDNVMPDAHSDPHDLQRVLRDTGLKMLNELLDPDIGKALLSVIAGMHQHPWLAEGFTKLYDEILDEMAAYLRRVARAHDVKVNAKESSRDFFWLIMGLGMPYWPGVVTPPSARVRAKWIDELVSRFIKSLGITIA